jgi:DNA topoisomerase-1
MEEGLDGIANDKGDWVSLVQSFYTPLSERLDAAAAIERVKLEDELTEETCPNCERQLAVKTGRFGKFLACTGYPDCKYTKSYRKKTGVACPECGGDLVEKRSKKGRTFYGCSNYPECNFATFARPVKDPCPLCGSLMTEFRGKQAKCTKCGHTVKLQQD